MIQSRRSNKNLHCHHPFDDEAAAATTREEEALARNVTYTLLYCIHFMPASRHNSSSSSSATFFSLLRLHLHLKMRRAVNDGHFCSLGNFAAQVHGPLHFLSTIISEFSRNPSSSSSSDLSDWNIFSRVRSTRRVSQTRNKKVGQHKWPGCQCYF